MTDRPFFHGSDIDECVIYATKLGIPFPRRKIDWGKVPPWRVQRLKGALRVKGWMEIMDMLDDLENEYGTARKEVN